MYEFQYLNYQEVNNRLDKLVNNPESKLSVRKERPIGYTDFLLPIDHYTIGTGDKHIIVTGSYHSAEIITTTFVVRLMEELALNPGDFNPDEYTIDFFPIVNPEGYLITTSMQDLYLEKGKTEEEKIALAKDYWRINRQDAINTANSNKVLRNEESSEEDRAKATEVLRGKKGCQALYDDVDQERFLKDYPELKASVMSILKKGNYPIGVCSAWNANGHGIDLSQNVPYNALIDRYKREDVYAGAAYANIKNNTPGPLNCPCRDLNKFTIENENLCLLQFLCQLSSKKEISAFLNYHSIMGKMYQRPVKEDSIIDLYHIDYMQKLTENYVGARTMREENAYDVIEGEDPYNYINEYFRLRFGIDIQPELSRMGGNPIGPLADPKTFEEVTIKPNIRAFRNFVANLNFIKEYSKLINNLVAKLNNRRESIGAPVYDAKEMYRLIDSICQNNPSLYIALRDEMKKPNAQNSHVISYLFYQIEQSLNKVRETEPIKESVMTSYQSEEAFVANYSDFLRKLIERINNEREAKKQAPLSEEQVNNLIDNLSLDYPEIFARLKSELSKTPYNEETINILYGHLETIIDNQLKMGNLIK